MSYYAYCFNICKYLLSLLRSFCNLNRLLSNFLICLFSTDANCVQVLAPDNVGGLNKGDFHPGEHIGHLKREWAAKLAPILDDLICTNMLHLVSFDCYLRDGDTSHQKKGYTLNIVIMCRGVLSSKLANLIEINNL